MKKFYSLLSVTVLLMLATSLTSVNAQTTVFSDNFNRASLATGAPTTYTTTVTAGDGGASINGSSFLEITNDATGAANVNGMAYATGLISSYSSPYVSTLSSNTSVIEWTFNLRYNRTAGDPAAPAIGAYSVAVVLAGSSATIHNVGSGYAIVYGNSGTTDPIRLVRYNNGVTGTLTDVCTSGALDLASINNYASVRVVYNPSNDNWALYVRDDGASAWADPTSGVTTQKGSTTANSTSTGLALGTFGFFWSYGTTANQTDQFDNFRVTTNNPTLNVSSTSLAFGSINLGVNSTSQSFNLSGTDLTGFSSDITATSPSTDFQVSNDNSTWGATTTIPYTSATLSAAPVYVRFTPQSTGAKSGNITFSGGGSTTFLTTVAVTGTGVAIANNEFQSRQTGNWNATTTWTKGLPGTVVFTNGSATVTGTSTAFTTNLVVGDVLMLQTSSGTVAGTVLSIGSATSLTLTAPYGGTTTSSVPYGKQATPTSADGVITILNGHNVTVTANVTVDQVVVNQGGQVTVNSGVTWTIANGTGTDLTVSGTVQDDGTITGPQAITINSMGTINVTGVLNLTTGDPVLTVSSGGNLDFSGTASMSMASVSSLNISGTLTMTGSSTITVTRGNGGNTAVVLSGGIVTMSGTTSISLDGNGNNSMQVMSGGTLAIGPSATIIGIGDFTLDNGGTLKIGSINGITTGVTASGNIQNTGGARSYGLGANYEYNGTANQDMGNGFPTNLTGILTINNPGNTVTLDNPRTIASGGSVAFTSGLLSTTTTNLLTFAAGSNVSGASDASYATGPVRKIGNTAFAFPVGKSPAGYHQIDISAPSVITDAFTAEYIRASATAFGGGVTSPLSHVSNCEYWQLDRTTGTSDISVTLYWTASSPCNSNPYITTGLSGLRVARYNGASGASTWMNEGTSGVSGDGTAGNITSGAAVSTWAPTPAYFTLGSVNSESPLPVKLSSIKAYEKQQGIQLDWTTSQEQNMSRYSIERSADGNSFTSIGQVASRNSAAETKYGFFDASPLPGINFYRLRMINMDEKFAYSPIVKVNLDKNVKDISLYPNPATSGYISFQGADLAKGNYTVRIFNSAGVQVMGQSFSHSGGAINQTLKLPAGTRSGMYSLQLINDNEQVMSKMFMVQ